MLGKSSDKEVTWKTWQSAQKLHQDYSSSEYSEWQDRGSSICQNCSWIYCTSYPTSHGSGKFFDHGLDSPQKNLPGLWIFSPIHICINALDFDRSATHLLWSFSIYLLNMRDEAANNASSQTTFQWGLQIWALHVNCRRHHNWKLRCISWSAKRRGSQNKAFFIQKAEIRLELRMALMSSSSCHVSIACLLLTMQRLTTACLSSLWERICQVSPNILVHTYIFDSLWQKWCHRKRKCCPTDFLRAPKQPNSSQILILQPEYHSWSARESSLKVTIVSSHHSQAPQMELPWTRVSWLLFTSSDWAKKVLKLSWWSKWYNLGIERGDYWDEPPHSRNCTICIWCACVCVNAAWWWQKKGAGSQNGFLQGTLSSVEESWVVILPFVLIIWIYSDRKNSVPNLLHGVKHFGCLLMTAYLLMTA